MNITVAVVGRLKERHYQAAEAEYVKRMRPYCSLTVREFRSETDLLDKLPQNAAIYAFDETGETPTSREFSRDILERESMHGSGRPLVLAIGGADGHTDALRQRALKLISFGRLTIGHRLVRLLVLEQLYRGFRILRGEPYHRD